MSIEQETSALAPASVAVGDSTEAVTGPKAKEVLPAGAAAAAAARPVVSTEKIVAGLKDIGLYPLVDTVCRRFFLRVPDVCGRSRTKNIVKARHAVWWELRHRCSFSYVELSRIFDRDHTTIVHAMRGLELAKTAVPKPNSETQAA